MIAGLALLMAGTVLGWWLAPAARTELAPAVAMAVLMALWVPG